MPTLVSAGVSVTIIDESFYIPASASTVPLFFIATRADKKQPDSVSDALGALENGVVRTITSLNSSVTTYGIPYFRTDQSGAQLHGDARNEYGLMGLNQALGILSRAYVVRADVDLADADLTTYAASAPQLTGSGNGVISDLVVNQSTASDELWTLTCDSTWVISATIANAGGSGTPGAATVTGTTGTGTKFQASVTIGGGGTITAINSITVPGDYTVNPTDITVEPVTGGSLVGATLNLTMNASFTVSGFVSGAQGLLTVGVPYNNGVVSLLITQGATVFSATDAFTFNVAGTLTTDPLGVNDGAKRLSIVTALQAAINSNQDVRSELYEYNLIICPGYHEVIDELLSLNVAINEEAFVIADTPFDKTPENTATWALTVKRQHSQNVAYYYPHAKASNLDGVDVFAAASGVALRQIAYSDSVSEVWFPPAGPRRGVVTGVSDVGYLTGELGTATTFVPAPLSQGQRDVLYEFNKNVNIIPFFIGRGIMVFGQKTSYSSASALDRINVVRMLNKVKRDIRKAAFAYLFELNDRITRESIKQMIDNYLNDIMLRRGFYDFVTQCDEHNNTPTRIDRNELWVDIAVKPTKAVEFIYIPIRVISTGA